MSIALPRRRSIAGAVIISLAVGGLTLAPLSAATAIPVPQSNAQIVLNDINSARNAVEVSSLTSSDALDVIAQKYAVASAAKGKATAEPTVVPADVNTEAGAPSFDFSVGSFSSKSAATAAYAKLDALIVGNSAYDYAGIGYATKGTKTFVVALVADYVTAPLETQFATKPFISGTRTIGSILAARTTFAEQPDSISYDWTIGGEHTEGFIFGNLLPLFASDDLIGKRVSVTITALKAGYAPLVISSGQSVAISRAKATPSVTVSGDRNVGRTLYAGVALSHFSFFASPDISYQWYRGTSKIEGATYFDYTQTAQDLKKKIWARATVSGSGFVTQSDSSSKSIVTKPRQIEYTSGVNVTWTDESTITVGSVATVDVGDWLDYTPDTDRLVSPGIGLKIQWLVDGKAVKGATGETFTVPASAATKYVSVRVTGKQSGRETTVRTSNSSYIAGLTFEASPSVSISGDFLTGKKLTANVEGVPAGAKVSYEWRSALFSNKKLASSKSLTLTRGMVYSHLVGVEVTISAPGYNTIVVQDYVTDLEGLFGPL